MKTGEVGKNLAWSMLLTGANYLFPLVVYMHVSRVLGASGVGLVGFIDSVTTYFILFSMMGISALGVRTVANSRGDIRKLSSAFWSLLTLHGLFTLAVLVVMVLATLFVSELRDNTSLMCVGMCKLVFNVLLVEWFFVGMEQFRYITLRTLAIKTIYLVSVFLLVRAEQDLFIYYMLTMLVVLVTAAVNMHRASLLAPLREACVRILMWVKKFFSLGVFELVTATYALFGMVWLGLTCSEEAVGCYSTASKTVVLVTALFAAYTSVLSPRASRSYSSGDLGALRRYALRSLLLIGVAGCIAGWLLWSESAWAVRFMSGSGYEGAVEPLRILALALPAIGVGRVLNWLVLIPAGCETRIAVGSAAGFLSCALVTMLAVPTMETTGAALGWAVGETVSTILSAVWCIGLAPRLHRRIAKVEEFD